MSQPQSLKDYYQKLETDLQNREHEGLLRQIPNFSGTDFTSNDYLNYSQDAELIKAVSQGIQKYGVGTPASRLLHSGASFIQSVEQSLADFSRRKKICGRDSEH